MSLFVCPCSEKKNSSGASRLLKFINYFSEPIVIFSDQFLLFESYTDNIMYGIFLEGVSEWSELDLLILQTYQRVKITFYLSQRNA